MGASPAPSGGRLSASHQLPSGWVFATQVVEEEPAVDDIVEGIILINDVRCRALIDTGVSHSFISRSFSMTHELRVLMSEGIKVVQVPEHLFVVTEYSLAYPAQIGDLIMLVDFLVFRRLGDFDVVLRMDLLSWYYATID